MTPPSPPLCGSTVNRTGCNGNGADPEVILSPFEEASGLVESRRTSVPSGTAHTGLPELAPPWVLGSPRTLTTDSAWTGSGDDAELTVPTGAGLLQRSRCW